jgi:GNAT superfamily N-acetyltransferase
MIKIKEAKTKKEMKQFVTFPFDLYKDNPYWVPPIINDELDGFNPKVNPVFKHAKATFLLAYNNDKIVGRLVAIINSFEVEKQQIKKMRFGWFDVVDDIEVSKALLSEVERIGKENSLEFIEGPVGFSNLDKVGVLTKGYDYIGTMITWYNYPYYVTHLEKLKFKPEKKYVENYFMVDELDPSSFQRAAPILKKRFGLKEKNFSNSKDVMPYVDEMFQLFNLTYSKLSSFVPISDEQIAYFKRKFISFINPELIKFVLDSEGKIIAFSIMMPSFAKALQKAKGKLFPFGIFHLLKAKKKNDTVIAYLIGVHPDYQNKGITAIIFDEFYKTVTQKGIKKLIRTPELEDNIAEAQIWKRMDNINHKRRATFSKKIS